MHAFRIRPTAVRVAASLSVAASFVAGCARATSAPAPAAVAPPSDSAFALVQSRGAQVMGVDQYTSTHVFESLPDGGRIALQRDAVDPVGEATIRAHMRDIAARFSRGDFTLPGVVHAMPEVPGTRVMAQKRRRIRYRVQDLPRGGQVRIVTKDPAAIEAVHAFLAFQRMDHRAMGHDHR